MVRIQRFLFKERLQHSERGAEMWKVHVLDFFLPALTRWWLKVPAAHVLFQSPSTEYLLGSAGGVKMDLLLRVRRRRVERVLHPL